MKRIISFLVFLSSHLIFQACCSIKIPFVEDQLPIVGELVCAGKGTKVSLDRFIIRLKIPPIGEVKLTDAEIIDLMRIVFQQQQITLERCSCGDPDLMMIILGEPVESKGELLTSVAGLKGGENDRRSFAGV